MKWAGTTKYTRATVSEEKYWASYATLKCEPSDSSAKARRRRR